MTSLPAAAVAAAASKLLKRTSTRLMFILLSTPLLSPTPRCHPGTGHLLSHPQTCAPMCSPPGRPAPRASETRLSKVRRGQGPVVRAWCVQVADLCVLCLPTGCQTSPCVGWSASVPARCPQRWERRATPPHSPPCPAPQVGPTTCHVSVSLWK